MQDTNSRQFELTAPIVIKRRRKQKKSKSFEEAVRVERHVTKAMARVIGATDAGFGAFRRSRKKSQKRESARYAMDIIPNLLDASAVTMRGVSVVPVDLMKAFYTRRTSKLVRKTVKSASRAVSRALVG